MSILSALYQALLHPFAKGVEIGGVLWSGLRYNTCHSLSGEFAWPFLYPT